MSRLILCPCRAFANIGGQAIVLCSHCALRWSTNSDDALHSLIHHRHRYALPVAAVCCPGYINLWSSPLPSLRTRPAVHIIFISRDRTKQIVEHVRCAHNSSNSQRNSNPSPSHTHPRELHCGNDPISSPLTSHRRVFRAFVIVHP